MSVIDTASRVLREEAAAVLGLQKKLDDSFEMAVHMIASARGRVILTGMGKSGHIARKVAATMASTGNTCILYASCRSNSRGSGYGYIGRCGDCLL